MTALPATNALSTLDKLDWLIGKATEARLVAKQGRLFVSHEGAALLNAIHDLTEIDAVYEAACDVETQVTPERDRYGLDFHSMFAAMRPVPSDADAIIANHNARQQAKQEARWAGEAA